MKKYTEFLKCEYSDPEMADMAKELARANQSRETLEQRKKQISSQIKGEIEEQTTVIKRLSSAIREGCEYKDIECRVELDTPEVGKKRVIRLDTGEEVAVKPMTESDRQMVMDLQTAAEAAEAEAKQQEPIITPPPVLQALLAPEVMSAAEVAEEDGAPLAAAHLVGGTHQKKRKGKEAAAGDQQ